MVELRKVTHEGIRDLRVFRNLVSEARLVAVPDS